MPTPALPPAPAAAHPHVPQLLMVYDPQVNARAIRHHVERLRQSGFVWWGRFYGGIERFDADAARALWPHVAQLADEREKAKQASLLFITNYVDLHVLKVTRIALGDNPPGGVRAHALPYYEARSVPVWFRVEDVRALSYDQGMTIDWFRQRLGVVREGAQRRSGAPYTRPYDLYSAALFQYPIVVDAPAAVELFDRAKPPKGAKSWAWAPDAMSSRPVQRAREHLEANLAPGLWARLSPEAQDLLANGWVEKLRLDHDEDVDPAMGYTRVANAVEAELCAELIGALEGVCARSKKSHAAVHESIAETLSRARPRDAHGQPVPWSLGPSLDVLRTLVNRERRSIEKIGLKKVVQLGTDLKWFEQMKKLRDAASHKGSHGVRPALRRGLREFYEEGGRALVPVVEAREECGAWGEAGTREG